MMAAPNEINTVLGLSWLPIVKSADEATTFKLFFGGHLVNVPSNYGSRLTIGLYEPGAPAPDSDPRAKMGVWIVDPAGHRTTLEGPSFAHTFGITPTNRGDGLFKVYVKSPDRRYRLYAMLSDSGQAREPSGRPLIPWNFWYFPYSQGKDGENAESTAWAGTKLQPFQKYEQAFDRKGALDWELRNHCDPHGKRGSWEGHCDDAAPASVLFEEPPAAGITHKGVHFECEELKLLATEVAARYKKMGAPWILTGSKDQTKPIHARKPDEAPQEFGALKPADGLPGLLDALRVKLRDEGRPLCMDLRDATGENALAVWNHVVFHYSTQLWQEASEDPMVMFGKTTLYANLDAIPKDAASTGLPATIIEHSGGYSVKLGVCENRYLVYKLRFDRSGWPDPRSDDHRWIEVYSYVLRVKTPTFAPAYALTMEGFLKEPDADPAASGNPFVLREDIDQLLPERKLE